MPLHGRLILSTLIVVVSFVGVRAEQGSLADVAKKTEKQRATAKQGQATSDETNKTKVYTNEDLGDDVRPLPVATSVEADQAPSPSAGDASTSAGT